MSESNKFNPNSAKFFEESIERFRTAPDRPHDDVDLVSRASTLGLLTGFVNSLVIPQVSTNLEGTNNDEISTLCSIAAGAFIGSIRTIRELCQSDPEKKAEKRNNALKSGAGGVTLGASIAALTPQALFSLLDGGIFLGCTLVAMGFSAYTNSAKTKYCMHCKAKGKCNQRVCRNCYRLFWPVATEIDCSQTISLDWLRIASFLQQQGLTYLDAELLVEKHLADWEIHPYNNTFEIDCDSFLTWVQKNKKVVLSFRKRGNEKLKGITADEYLRSKEL